MNILLITAGAAGMYCGSCLRDNALAAELMARGHQVLLLPLYTPTRTDEPNVSHPRVFFGAISVYLEQHLRLFRKSPAFLDRLWDSPRILRAASAGRAPTHPRLLGELTVSMLKGENGFQHKEFRKLIDWLHRQMVPHVINLPNSLLIGLAQPLKQALGSPVCCTLQGEDLFLKGLPEPYQSEALKRIRSSVPYVDSFLPVSRYHAQFMSGYLGIAPEKLHLVPLGINLQDYRRARLQAQPFTIGYLARITPEKGLHVLGETYRILRQERNLPKARLEVAGYLSPDQRAYLRRIRQQMTDWGLSREFFYGGAVDRETKIRFLEKLDVLCVPATCDEPKGIFALEAMAAGVPVVLPRRGAFQEIIEKTGGGLLVEPDDPHSLADAIFSLWKDRSLSAQLGSRGFEQVRQHYSVSLMAEKALEVYSKTKARPSA